WHDRRGLASLPPRPLATDPRTTAGGHLPPPAGQTRGDPEDRWQGSLPRYPDGGGSIHPASHCAGPVGAMGAPLPPAQLRLSPTTLGAPGATPRADEH